MLVSFSASCSFEISSIINYKPPKLIDLPFHIMFQNKNILIVSPDSWGGIFVSKHHYAVELSKRGNRVFFLNPPGNYSNICKSSYSNLSIINYKGFLKGLRFFPTFIQRQLVRNEFNKIQKISGVKLDIIWSFDNSVFYDLYALPLSLIKISHIVDSSQNFQTETAAKTADICFCNTDFLLKKLIAFNNNTFKIQHGYSHSFSVTEENLPGKGRLKCVYVGNLSIPYLNWQIIQEIVKENPRVDFIFVGPEGTGNKSRVGSSKDLKLIKEFSNTYFAGKVLPEKIFSYLQKADVLLIAYKANEYREQLANSHKLIEYLASGKVVVSSYTDEYRHKNLLQMVEKDEELPDMFKNVIQNIQYYNSEEVAKRRIAYAQDNTYAKQVSRIEKIMEEYVKK